MIKKEETNQPYEIVKPIDHIRQRTSTIVLQTQEMTKTLQSSNFTSFIALNKLNKKIEDKAQMRLIKCSSNLRSKYRKLKWLRIGVFYIYIIITIFQRPIWCNYEYDNNCKSHSDYTIPTMVDFYMPVIIYYCLEICILLFFAFSKIVSSKIIGNTFHYKTKTLIGLVFLIIINDIIVMILANDYKYNISLLMKPIIILFYRHSFYTIFSHYCQIIIRSRKIYYLMIFSLTFFAGLGVALFSDSENFSDEQCQLTQPPFSQPLQCVIILLFFLQTTVNSPDIYLPYYLEYRPQVLYFISFQFINTLLIINLIIATFYSSFKNFMEEKTHSYINNNNKNISKYAQCFLKAKTLQKINYINMNSQKLKVYKMMESKLYEILIQVICLCSFVSIFIHESQTKYQILFIFNSILLIEAVTLLKFINRKDLMHKKILIFEILINTLIFILNCISLTNFNQVRLLSIALCYRLFRGCQWLLHFTEYKYLILSVLQISHYIIQLFGPLFILFMIFTALGQLLFGGMINNSNSTPEHYELANFNDFLSGLCTCWFLLLVNNWNVLAFHFAQVLQSDLVYLFFIGFYILVVLFFLNVTIAQLIDYLVTKMNHKITPGVQ